MRLRAAAGTERHHHACLGQIDTAHAPGSKCQAIFATSTCLAPASPPRHPAIAASTQQQLHTPRSSFPVHTAAGAMRLTVQPRLQTEVWSLYWKEPSRTDTACLPPITLELDGAASVADLMQQAATQLGWPPEGQLTRLEGFAAPWQRALHAGRLLRADASLADAGLADDAVVTVVRIELVAEGWKILDDLSLSDDGSDDEAEE